MTTPFLVATVVALLVGALVFRIRQTGRARAIAQLRATWGQPTLRERKMDAIAESHRSRAAGAGENAALDDRTWNDLLMDDVFAACDRTESTLGQHALYHRLRSTPADRHLDAFEALVTRMTEDVAARERAQLALARLRDPHGYDLWWIGQREVLEPRAWHIVFPVLALIMLGLIVTLPIWPGLLPLLVAAVAAGLMLRYSANRRVLDVAAAFRKFAPIIATGQALTFLEGPAIDPLVAPLRQDTASLGRLKTIARWVSGDPFMLSVSPSGFAVIASDVAGIIYDYVNYLFLLDANGVYFGAAELRKRGGALLRVMAAAGDVDAAISVASYRSSLGTWTRPAFLASGATATLANVRHPLVADAVPNSLPMVPGRGVLVTGSNMSGKSTLLRTVGVNVLLAQTIHTCLAETYAAPVFTLRSCIGRSDDLLSGKSYYIVEVESLNELVRASQGEASHLFLLDEMFRGTNAVERIAAGQAVLRGLVECADGRRRHVVLAATHDGELVDLLPDRFDAVHFGDTVGDDGIVFNYQLQSGRATTRNAIALLKQKGAPDRLVQEAMACAEALDEARAAGALRGR